MHRGYSALYEINEYAHDLSSGELKGVVVQVTGLQPESGTVRAILGSFKALRQFADFDTRAANEMTGEIEEGPTVVGAFYGRKPADPAGLHHQPASTCYVGRSGVQRHLQESSRAPSRMSKPIVLDAVKAFAATSQLIERDLDQVESEYETPPAPGSIRRW